MCVRACVHALNSELISLYVSIYYGMIFYCFHLGLQGINQTYTDKKGVPKRA